MLDKDTIKTEILPLLSKAKRGYVTQSCLIEVVNAISYKLKTGLPMGAVKALFSDKVLSHDTVYHHYNKWSKAGELKSMWIRLLDKQRNELDMSSMDLDDFSLNAGFDYDVLRGILPEKEIIANVCINKRKENADNIFVDDELYAKRYSIERANAWMDNFRTLQSRLTQQFQVGYWGITWHLLSCY